MESLRSSVWSSETLLSGVNHVSQQPDGLLVTKNEEDADLVEQLRVPLLDLKSISCFVCHENSTSK